MLFLIRRISKGIRCVTITRESWNYVMIFCGGGSWYWGSDQYTVYGSTRYSTYDETEVSGNDGCVFIHINYDSVYTSSYNTIYIMAVCNLMSQVLGLYLVLFQLNTVLDWRALCACLGIQSLKCDLFWKPSNIFASYF